jgi:prophage antirepressor-like protein
MSAIVPFSFDEKPVRVVERDGVQWFSLNDVCAVLEIANPRDAAGRLDDDEKDVVITDTLGGRQEATVIDESGLYKLVLRSRKASAKRFSKWVTREVLPSIRRTGGYGQAAPVAPLDDNATLRALLLGRIDRLDELQPKADALDRIADSRGALNLTETAKALKMGRAELTRWMQAKAWIYRAAASGRWMAYRNREQALLLEHRVTRIPRPNEADRIVTTVMVTPKGLARLAAELAACEAGR